MIVTRATWQLVTAATLLRTQNVGTTRIAWVVAASLPGPTDITLDADEHGIFNPGENVQDFTDVATSAQNLYVRGLGSKDGELYVAAI